MGIGGLVLSVKPLVHTLTSAVITDKVSCYQGEGRHILITPRADRRKYHPELKLLLIENLVSSNRLSSLPLRPEISEYLWLIL